MKRTARRDCPDAAHAFKLLAGREKRHDRTGMTAFESGIRSRTIGIGLRRADRECVGLDRPEIGRDMQDARHGNGDHAGHPDQEPEVAQLRADSMEHVVEHAPLEATAKLSSMGMRAHAGKRSQYKLKRLLCDDSHKCRVATNHSRWRVAATLAGSVLSSLIVAVRVPPPLPVRSS